MKQLLTLVVLAGLAAACGDDDGDSPGPGKVDGGVDAGRSADGGPLATAKVNNPGAACTVATVATSCGGTAPVCAAATWAGIAYPGNQCEATCTTSAECGSNGACPIGEALASTIGQLIAPALMTQSGVCYQKCTVGSGTNSGCRDGYVCETVATALGGGQANIVPQFTGSTVCIPAAGLAPLPSGDAGVRDGGATSSVDGGLDSGL